MFRWSVVIGISAALLGEESTAQSLVRSPGKAATTFGVEADLVLVPTVVTDRNYKPVFDLREQQFELRVDRSVIPLAGFWKDTGPLSIVIVLDVSKSMRKTLLQSKEAVRGFLNLAHPDDEYAVVLCKEHGVVEVPFTSNLRAVETAITEATAAGGTPLYDSLQLALDLVRKGQHQRKAILMITDGEDTTSRIKFKAIRNAVLETTAYLYVLQFWLPKSIEDRAPEPLQELADLTGGIFFDNVSAKRFAEYMHDLDLHQRYILAFRPAAAQHDNKRHRVRVKLQDVDHPKAKVFWRHSYLDAERAEVR